MTDRLFDEFGKSQWGQLKVAPLVSLCMQETQPEHIH